jgi:outer membrane protein OmpA-like peptidoglycan-associated protein
MKESIMRNITKAISIGLLSVVGLVTTSVASAQDVTLGLEAGVSAPLTSPQTDRYGLGGAGAIRVNIGLTPYLDIVPGVSALALSGKNGGDMGTAWGFGGGLRLKRPHNVEVADLVEAVSPWVSSDVEYVRTGGLDRVAFSTAVGAAWPTSEDRNLWVGPYARYQNIFQGDKLRFDDRDSRVLTVGLSLEIDPGAKKVAPPTTTTKLVPYCPDRDRDGVPDGADRCPDVPGPASNNGCPVLTPPTQVEVALMKHVIRFNWDSALLSSKARADLDSAAKHLLNSTDKVVVAGHASSEGQVEHNKVLATKRAQAVVDYLVAKGVARDRLSAKGFGSSAPAATNATPAGRELNRRAEFVVSFIIVKEGK